MQFDLEFEEAILAQSLQDSEYLKRASRLLDTHHFASKQHGWIWKVVKGTWVDFAERATPKILMARASRDFQDEDEERAHLELVARLFKATPSTPKAALEELSQFIRFVSLQVAMEEGAKALEGGNVDRAFDQVRKATLMDLRPKSYKLTRWMEDFDERQRGRKHRAEHPEDYVAIPTGIARLDDIIIGVQAGELAAVMATTGRGKSIWLNHIGYQAIIRGYGVVHFSLEMPDHQVAARYDSRFTGMLHKKFKTHDFSADELRAIDSRLQKMKDRLKGKLQIISMPLRRCNINSVRHAVEEVAMEMPVHMVIIDSGDHMQSMTKHDQHRLNQAEVYWDLKTFAEEDGYAVWTSTHAGREWEKRIATAEAAAESYDKSRICDLMITLNEPKGKSRTSRVVTGDEEDEEGSSSKVFKRSTLEAFLAKYRDGEGKVRIPLDTDFTRMLIQEQDEDTGTST